MNIKEMTIEQLETRSAEIITDMDKEGADLNALEQEARSIREELEARKNAEAQKANIRQSVAAGNGRTLATFETPKAEEKKPEEIRSSAEYCEAYKKYIMTGDAKECRSLLTENVNNGVVPVPTILEEGIKTAWESDQIMSRVHRTFVRGNLKVAFELSATDAAEHTEGAAAPTEEEITLGIVEMIPANVKKWITLSDEVVALGGEAFVRYIYDEITYKIVQKAAALGIADIVGAPASSSATAIGVKQITGAPSVTLLPTAAANLSEDAANVCVVMNRLTEVKFIEAYAAGNFAIDPFAGLPRVYTSALPAYDTASAGAVYAIVGDLSALQYNFPEGEGIVLKWDDMSLAEKDMVKVVGRQYAAHAVTAPGKLVNIKKGS